MFAYLATQSNTSLWGLNEKAQNYTFEMAFDEMRIVWVGIEALR
jgi:hypothetical protein